MNWISGTLTYKCIRGRTYKHYGVSYNEAQRILDQAFDDPANCVEAMYFPNPTTMEVSKRGMVGVSQHVHA